MLMEEMRDAGEVRIGHSTQAAPVAPAAQAATPTLPTPTANEQPATAPTPPPADQTPAPQTTPQTAAPQDAGTDTLDDQPDDIEEQFANTTFTNEAEPSDPAPLPSDNSYSWTATEFVAQQKSKDWYIKLGAVAVVIMVLTWFISSRDIFATLMVAVGMLLLGIYARRQPREEQYTVDDSGVMVGQRHYPYADFRSFTVAEEGELANIELMPMKRFAMYTAMYCKPADEDKVLAILGSHLPMEEPRNDITDNFMRRIRF